MHQLFVKFGVYFSNRQDGGLRYKEIWDQEDSLVSHITELKTKSS